jgi:hypothetical protein
MKSFYVFLIACVIGLSASVEAKNSNKEVAPWSNMAPEDKAMYEKQFKCNEATTVMKLVVKWPVILTAAADDNGLYNKTYVLDDVSSAIVGYKTVKKGKDIPVVGIITIGEMSILAIEFHYIKYIQSAIKAGKTPETVTIAESIKNSTGKYFCYIN